MARLGAAVMLTLLVTTGAAAQGSSPEIALEDVVVERHGDTGVVWLKTSGPPRHRAQWLDEPPRLMIDLPDTRYAWKLSRLAGPIEPVDHIRGTQLRPGLVRVVVEMTRKVAYRIEVDGQGLRVSFPVGDGPPGAPADRVRRTGPHLVGVIHGVQGWVAYIEDPQTRRAGAYRVGDALGAAVVERIAAESVTLKGPEGAVILQLGDGQPGLSAR